jgi:hypothetical protein
MLSLTMLVMSEGGATYPEMTVRGWLNAVGLGAVERIQVEDDIALLVAQRVRTINKLRGGRERE